MNSSFHSFLKQFITLFVHIKVFALVGRSGTGKSFRAQALASKYRIPLIIDDGLLIKHDKIVAGKSAKQEENFLTAVKCAVFKNPEHREEVIEALDKELFTRILVIGTSENMISKITKELNLPYAKVIIHIEDIASEEEINTAMKIRFSEGKHVIPVSPVQITRSYPQIVYDAVRSLTKSKYGKKQITEKTLVRPHFSQVQHTIITEPVMKQMISQSLYEYGNTIKIENVSFSKNAKGYNLNVVLRTPGRFDRLQHQALSNHIADSLERYGDLLIENINVEIRSWVLQENTQNPDATDL